MALLGAAIVLAKKINCIVIEKTGLLYLKGIILAKINFMPCNKSIDLFPN